MTDPIFRRMDVNRAVELIHQARLDLAHGSPDMADLSLRHALDRLTRGLDLGPSAEAVEAIVRKEVA